MISLVHHPDGPNRLGDLLIENLSATKWTHFRAAIAFVKNSGVKHLKQPLRNFLVKGEAKISAGVDHAGTSREGVSELLDALGEKGQAWIVHNEYYSTFHPKIYLFSNATHAECFIGSGNLTEGGLFRNYEAFIHLQLEKSKPDDQTLLSQIEKLLDEWSDSAKGTALKLTPQLIEELAQAGYLPTEAQIRQVTEEAETKIKRTAAQVRPKKLFASVAPKPAPKVPGKPKPALTEKGAVTPLRGRMSATGHGFLMTLQQTDVGVGQTTAGTSRRSPEIFIPLAARDANPSFWGWKSLFHQDPAKPGKYDRRAVRMRLGANTIEVNMMTWPDKSDFRLRNAELRDAGSLGDIMRIERSDGKAGYDYTVEMVPTGAPEYASLQAMCTQTVRNSNKRWGYY